MRHAPAKLGGVVIRERHEIRQALRDLVGVQMPGGCDDCDAVTHLAEETPGQFRGHVGHEPACPTWTRIRNGRPAMTGCPSKWMPT